MSLTPAYAPSCWGYNGHVNSTMIEAVEGDRVRIYVTNRLPVPPRCTGTASSAQRHGRRRRADPAAHRAGRDVQVRVHAAPARHVHVPLALRRDDPDGAGHDGHVRHPPAQPAPEHQVDRDFAIMLSEWRIDPGTAGPNPNEMTDFNVLTMNGKGFPGTGAAGVPRLGDRVRIRLGNLGAMDHHPIHLHGYHFRITATDGGQIPESAQWPETTVLVPVGQHAHHRVRRRRARRLGAALPHDPPRDEPDGPRHPEHDRRRRRGSRREGQHAAARLHDDGPDGHGRAWPTMDMPVPTNSIPMRRRRRAVRLHRHGRHVHGAQGAERISRATTTPAGTSTRRARSQTWRR